MNTPVFYQNHELVAIHPRATHVGQCRTLDDHLPPEHVAYKMRDPQWCLKQAEKVGEQCHELIQRLFEHRALDRLRAAQGIVRLGQRYGASRLEAACQRALFFNNLQYRAIRIILEKGLDQNQNPQSCFDTLSDTYTGQGHLLRDTRDLFN